MNHLPKFLMALFMQKFGDITTLGLLTPAGSDRKYYRFITVKGYNCYSHYSLAKRSPYIDDPSVPDTVIGMDGGTPSEAHTFLYLSHHFREKGLPVPQIYDSLVEEGYPAYLQEDLGEASLFDVIRNGRTTGQFSEDEKALIKRVIRLLPAIQIKGDEGLDYRHCSPQAEFNNRTVMWDLNYFKYCFLKTTGVRFNEDRLEDDFEKLSDILNDKTVRGFMYRDFQSRNVMIRAKDYLEKLSCFYLDDTEEEQKERMRRNRLESIHGDPYFIDYQGGRRGPVLYDVASFVWQAKANYPEELKEELVEEYLEALSQLTPIDKETLRKQLVYFVLFRMLQVLGAYGFRGKYEHKTHFLESIPFALESLLAWIEKYSEEFDTQIPYLHLMLQCMCKGELGMLEDEEEEDEEEEDDEENTFDPTIN